MWYVPCRRRYAVNGYRATTVGHHRGLYHLWQGVKSNKINVLVGVDKELSGTLHCQHYSLEQNYISRARDSGKSWHTVEGLACNCFHVVPTLTNFPASVFPATTTLHSAAAPKCDGVDVRGHDCAHSKLGEICT